MKAKKIRFTIVKEKWFTRIYLKLSDTGRYFVAFNTCADHLVIERIAWSTHNGEKWVKKESWCKYKAHLCKDIDLITNSIRENLHRIITITTHGPE